MRKKSLYNNEAFEAPYLNEKTNVGIKPRKKDSCLSRIPYSSLIAFKMCFIGVILFSFMIIWSFNATIEQIRQVFDIRNIPWLDKMRIFFFMSVFLMIVVAFSFLCIGILSTGTTREEIFKRKSAIRGGQTFCILALTLSYLLNFIWIILISLTAIFTFIYYVFTQLCSSISESSNNHCLNFSVFKPLFEFSDSSLILCSGKLQHFCASTNTVFVWYAIAHFSSIIVCLSLVQFISSHAANYAHIGNENRYRELQEIIYTETSLPTTTSFVSNSYAIDPMPNEQRFLTNKPIDFNNDYFKNDTYHLKNQNLPSCEKLLQNQNYSNSLHALNACHYPPTVNSHPFNFQHKVCLPREFDNNYLMQDQNLKHKNLQQVPSMTSIAMRHSNNGAVNGAINTVRRNSYYNSLGRI